MTSSQGHHERLGWKDPICPQCKTPMVIRQGRWICLTCAAEQAIEDDETLGKLLKFPSPTTTKK